MKRKISFYVDIKTFKVTMHDVDLILNKYWVYHVRKLNTGKKTTISTSSFKDKDGNPFPFYKRPKLMELRSKEGSIKIGVSDVIYDF